jgi:dihydropteroate synthase
VAATPTFRALGFRVLIGASRKGFVGKLTGVSRPQDRVAGSIGAALAAAGAGADILRVHDVRATREALLVWQACRAEVTRSAP